MDGVQNQILQLVEKAEKLMSPLLNSELFDATHLSEWLKEHSDAAILVTVGALLAGTFYVANGGKSGKKGKGGQEKKFKLKIKKQPVIPVDPVKKSYDTINEANKELESVFIPQVNRLEEDVAKERETGKPLEFSSYKESTEYRFLYLGETLLKLLMRLDGVDPQLLGDSVSDAVRADIRHRRKETVKAVQAQCKRVDALKPSKKTPNAES